MEIVYELAQGWPKQGPLQVIQQYQDRAHDLVIRFAPATEPGS